MPPHEIGVVCGVQNSVQALSETASFVAGTLLTDPSQVGMSLRPPLARKILSKMFPFAPFFLCVSAGASLRPVA